MAMEGGLVVRERREINGYTTQAFSIDEYIEWDQHAMAVVRSTLHSSGQSTGNIRENTMAIPPMPNPNIAWNNFVCSAASFSRDSTNSF